MRIALVLLALTALAGCTDPCAEPGPADYCHYWDPGEPGMFPVGVITTTYTDADRVDMYGRPRQLPVEVWYPTIAYATRLPDDQYQLLDSVPPELEERAQGLTVPPVSTTAKRDAPLDRRFAPYPLLVFSHGKGGLRYQTYSLMLHMASHGYIVAAVDHTDDTIWDLIINFDRPLDDLFQSMEDRPKDCSFVADQLDAGNSPLGPGVVDLERWGMFGHSFGATTSIVMAAKDSEFEEPRVKAVVALAPATLVIHVIGAGPDQSRVPLMIQGGLLDDTLPFEQEMQYGYDIANEPKIMVTIPKAGHFSFTELCPMDLSVVADHFGVNAENVLSDGCGPDFLPLADMHRIQNHFTAAFFNHYLRGSEATVGDMASDNLPADITPNVEISQAGVLPEIP